VRTLLWRLLCSNRLLARRSKKQSSGNAVISDALALHIHISMIDAKLVFQAQQWSAPNKIAQMSCHSRTSGRFLGPSSNGIDQNVGTEVDDVGTNSR
jgi:hypothetical protein